MILPVGDIIGKLYSPTGVRINFATVTCTLAICSICGRASNALLEQQSFK
jgi:hypothetical protein